MNLYQLCILFFIAIIGCKTKEVNNNTVSKEIVIENAYVKHDQSEADISWWPTNYPLQKMQNDSSNKLIARIIYSRPHKKGREIFGNKETNLCRFGVPWRLGANEATEITFFEDVIISNRKVSKGNYIIYCIPQKDIWTIRINTNLYSWGLNIDSTKDILSTNIKTELQKPVIEDFTIVFEKDSNETNLVIAWDDVKVALPIEVAK